MDHWQENDPKVEKKWPKNDILRQNHPLKLMEDQIKSDHGGL